MRILHITTQKPYSTGSGIYVSGMLKELEKDHAQYLICGLNLNEDQSYLESWHSFKLDPVLFQSETLPFAIPGMSDVMPYTSRRYDSLTDREARRLKIAFQEKIQKAMEEFQPDAVLSHHLYLITALAAETVKEKADIPVVGVCHGSDLRQFRMTDRWRYEIQSGLGKLDAIISTHPEQAEVISDLHPNFADRIHILGSGFDDEIFKADPCVTKESSPLRIVYTGKLARAKGVLELLSAVAVVSKVQDVSLTLIGGGGDPKETEEIQLKAEGEAYPVVITGQISQKQAAEIYHRSHLFILPSYYEGMPLVVPEALAAGMKVAVTDLPGFDAWLEPFSEWVRLIPRPEMISLDEPTEEGRRQFIQDIAEGILELWDAAPSKQADLSLLSWKGLAERTIKVLDGLQQE